MNPILGIIVSIIMMAITVLVGNAVVLKKKPAPFAQALTIATVSNLLGKLFVSVLHLPGAVSYSVPTLVFFILSHYFFKPSFGKLIAYWLAGFAAYLIIHILLSSFLGWTFMFPFWRVRLFS